MTHYPPPTRVAVAAPGMRSPVPGAVVAAAGVAVTLVTRLLGLYTDVFADLGRWGYVVTAAPYVVIAIGVFVLAGSSAGRLGGVVVLAAAAVIIGLNEWQLHVIRHGAFGDSAAALRAIGWIGSLLPPVLVVLGWGVARRRGALWLVGVAAAGIIAAAVYELNLHTFARVGEHGLDAVRLFEVVLTLAAIVTVLAGTLLGWALERAERPSASSAKQL